MQLLNSFFGIVFLLTIVICGVTWLFSAHQGIRIARGLALAVLPFFIGTIAMPSPGTSLPWGGVQIVIAFTILLAALFASEYTFCRRSSEDSSSDWTDRAHQRFGDRTISRDDC